MLFEGSCTEPTQLVEEALLNHDDFLSAVQVVDVNQHQAKVSEAVKWKKPKLGVIKVNCDAAVDERSGCGIGLIARDWDGKFCFLGAKRVQQSGVVEILEAEALCWAMQMSVENEVTHACFESDCLSLVTNVRSGRQEKGVLGILLKRIQAWGSQLECSEVVYSRRQANRVAHALAHLKPSVALFSCLDFAIPETISVLLCDDLN